MLREYAKSLYYFLFVADVALGVIIFALLGTQPSMHTATLGTPLMTSSLTALGLFACLAWPRVLKQMGVYTSQRRDALSTILLKIFGGSIGCVILMAALAYSIHAPVARSFPLLFGGVYFLALATLRIMVFYALHRLRRSGRNYRNVLVIGAGQRARDLQRQIESHSEWGQRIIGFIDEGMPDGKAPMVPASQIKKYIDVPQILRFAVVDEVIVACPRSMLASIDGVVNECVTVGVPVTLLTDLFGNDLPPPQVHHYGAMITMSFAPVHHDELALALKRVIDIVVSAVLLVLLAPLLALAAVAIHLDSAGGVLFGQPRSGRHGRSFVMIKLRTMCADAEAQKASLLDRNEMDGPVFKISNDPRVTRVGRFLRKWSIDELPQLWNVLRGDMSLVGPRPPTPDEVLQYCSTDRRRLSMRPGITCLWQVSGRNEISFEDWMKLDLQYIDTWSLLKDLQILLQTIPAVLRARGAS